VSEEPIAARQAYFVALRKHRPELLDSLRTDVLPEYEPRWSHPEDPLQRQALFESWDHLQRQDTARRKLLAALQRWAAQFHITESWILQTALDTLQSYSPYPDTPLFLARPRGRQRGWFWIYVPRTPYTPFQPNFENNIWWGSAEKWDDFRRRMTSQFQVSLDEYRRRVEGIVAARRKDTLNRDAEWTVRYQSGEAAFEIAVGLDGIDPEQTVYRAVERFARTIDLALRRARKRRKEA
jgi:hypothetical protein